MYTLVTCGRLRSLNITLRRLMKSSDWRTFGMTNKCKVTCSLMWAVSWLLVGLIYWFLVADTFSKKKDFLQQQLRSSLLWISHPLLNQISLHRLNGCLFVVLQVVSLYFDFFSTQAGADVLSIYDGVDTNGTLIANLSGSSVNLLGPYMSTLQHMFLIFTSDRSVGYPGFSAEYTTTTIGEKLQL